MHSPLPSPLTLKLPGLSICCSASLTSSLAAPVLKGSRLRGCQAWSPAWSKASRILATVEGLTCTEEAEAHQGHLGARWCWNQSYLEDRCSAPPCSTRLQYTPAVHAWPMAWLKGELPCGTTHPESASLPWLKYGHSDFGITPRPTPRANLTVDEELVQPLVEG